MQVKHNGITVSIEDAEIVRYALDRLSAESGRIFVPTSAVLPKIGSTWLGHGGVYAGIMRGRDGASDYHLVVGPEYDGVIQWQPAMDWSSGLMVDTRRDFALPYLAEQSVACGNVPELFKSECYWSCEQRASSSSLAWGQGFYGGGQYYWGKDLHFRARAVRRIPIR